MSVFDRLMDLQQQINSIRAQSNQLARLERMVVPTKIISVQYAEFTGTQSASVASHANVAVTSLSIAHTLAKSTNKLRFDAMVMVSNGAGQGQTGLAIADDGTLISLGDAASNRGRTMAGGLYVDAAYPLITATLPISIIYEPGDTSSHVYTVRAINLFRSTETVYVNRTEGDSDAADYFRGSSSFILTELEG